MVRRNLLVFFLLVCGFIASIEAAWQPTGAPVAIPTNENLGKPKVHPYLFLNEEEIEEIKLLVAEREDFKKAYELLQSSSEAALQKIKQDQSYASNFGNINEIKEMAYWYALTKDEEYAAQVANALLQLADRYRERVNTIHSQTLNISERMVRYAQAYDLIYNYLTEQQRTKLEDFMREVVAYILSLPRGMNNWQAWHNAAIGLVGFVLEDESLYTSAIWGDAEGFAALAEGDFSKRINYGFVAHLTDSLYGDGIWYEQSYDYHTYTLNSLTLLAEAAYRYGYDLYKLEIDGKSLKYALDGQLYHAYLTLAQPVFADGGRMSLRGRAFMWNYAFALRRYSEPIYRWIWDLSNPSNSQMPHLLCLYAMEKADYEPLESQPGIGSGPFLSAGVNMLGSSLLAHTGMGVLRGAVDTPEALNIAVVYKPNGKVAGHQHADNLGIEVLSPVSNHRWIPNTNKITDYGHILNAGYQQHTISRNTLVVDETSQKPQVLQDKLLYSPFPEEMKGRGRLSQFAVGPLFGYLEAESDKVYDGVLLNRRVINTDSYILDIFTAESDTERTYDWPIRIDGELVENNLELTSWDPPEESRPEIDSRNIMKNSSVETDGWGDISDWHVHPAWEPDYLDRFHGINSLKTSGRWNSLYQLVPVIPGASYELSFYAKNSTNTGTGRVSLSSQQSDFSTQFDFRPSTSWQQFKQDFTVPEDVSEIRVLLMNGYCETLWVDLIELRRIPDKPKSLGSRAGYQYVTHVQSAQTSDNWTTTWQKGGEKFRVTTLGAPETEAILAAAPRGENVYWPLKVVRRKGKDALFISLFECYSDAPKVQGIEQIDSTAVKITTIKGEDYIAWHDGVVEGSLAGAEYRGSVALCRLKGETLTEFLLVNGSSFAYPGISISVIGGEASVSYKQVNEGMAILSYSSETPYQLDVTLADENQLLIFELDGEGNFVSKVDAQVDGNTTSFLPKAYTNYALTIDGSKPCVVPFLFKHYITH